eukprot:3274149-Amphidinium_carterae.1
MTSRIALCLSGTYGQGVSCSHALDTNVNGVCVCDVHILNGHGELIRIEMRKGGKVVCEAISMAVMEVDTGARSSSYSYYSSSSDYSSMDGEGKPDFSEGVEQIGNAEERTSEDGRHEDRPDGADVQHGISEDRPDGADVQHGNAAALPPQPQPMIEGVSHAIASANDAQPKCTEASRGQGADARGNLARSQATAGHTVDDDEQWGTWKPASTGQPTQGGG